MTVLNAASLKDRLQKKMEADRKEVERLTENELNNLTENLKNTARNALHTISHDINLTAEGIKESLSKALHETEKTSETLKAVTIKKWFRTMLIGLVVGLSICISICGGSWGLMQYLSSQIQSNLIEIEKQEQALSQLQAQTWGLTLRETPDGNFIVLPPGTRGARYTVGDQEALKIERK